MAGPGAVVCGVGMATPVGDCAAQTATSVRAGISRYASSSILNRRLEPMTLALLPNDSLPPLVEPLALLSELTPRQERMLPIADVALRDVLDGVPSTARPPLFLAGPEAIPGLPPQIDQRFLDHLLTQTEAPIDREASRLLPGGRAAGLQAVGAALELLEAGGRELVLAGGVDSHLETDVLALLDREERVLAAEVLDGFAPGEGAAFLLLGTRAAAERLGIEAPAVVHAPGLAMEPGHRYSEAPYLGTGLAQAVADALAGASRPPVRTVFSTMNGESFWVKEWSVAYSRSANGFAPDFRLEHPAECFGDTGAAAGPILAGLAARGLGDGTVAGPVLVCASSEHAARAALLVTMGAEAGG